MRGALEKTYAVAIDLSEKFNDLLEKNSGEAYMQSFLQFILGFAELFQNYCKQDNINIAEDKSGFSLAPLYLTDDELETLVKKIREAIRPYDNNPSTKERKLHSIGVIISPPQNE